MGKYENYNDAEAPIEDETFEELLDKAYEVEKRRERIEALDKIKNNHKLTDQQRKFLYNAYPC
jgi:predicted DNA binding protein